MQRTSVVLEKRGERVTTRARQFERPEACLFLGLWHYRGGRCNSSVKLKPVLLEWFYILQMSSADAGDVSHECDKSKNDKPII